MDNDLFFTIVDVLVGIVIVIAIGLGIYAFSSQVYIVSDSVEQVSILSFTHEDHRVSSSYYAYTSDDQMLHISKYDYLRLLAVPPDELPYLCTMRIQQYFGEDTARAEIINSSALGDEG